MASSPTPRRSSMTPDSSEASVELQNIESPVGAHEKDDKEQGSFEVPLFNFNEVIRYMRKLKEENTLLKEQLETMQKEHEDKQEMFKDLEESFDQRIKMLSQEKMELEMKLQKVLQYGTVKDMERVLEKCGDMELKFEEMKGDMKEEMKKELKEELQQQLKSTIEEHEEKLSSVGNRTEQVSKGMESMKSKLSELESQVLADNVTMCGIKYIRKMKPLISIPDGTVQLRGPYGGYYFYVEREQLKTWQSFSDLITDLWDLNYIELVIKFNGQTTSQNEWSSKWESMIIKCIHVYFTVYGNMHYEITCRTF